MEIPAWLFFSFWAIISIIFLKLGFDALDRTNLSNSVPPVVLFFFKHALFISLCHSSHYTFVYGPPVQIPDNRSMYHFFIAFALLGPLIYDAVGGPVMWYIFPIWFFVFFYLYFIKLFFYGMFGDGIGFGIDFAIKLTMISFGDNKRFFPILVLLVGCYTAAVWAAIIEDEETMPVTAQDRVNEYNSSFSNKMRKLVEFGVSILRSILFDEENSSILKKILFKRRKLINFSIGMVGTILFQNFFRIKSFNHVLAFLYLSVSWLGNLALLRANGDLGIFNFLLANVIIGCTVSQFGFGGTTWIAFGATVLLYGLRVELQSLKLVNRGAEIPRVIAW